MARLDLRFKDLVASLDPATGRLHFERGGKRLPWEMDLGSGSVATRRRAAGASDETHPIRLASLAFKRIAAAHVQWIGDIGGAGLAINLELDGEGLALTVSPIGTGDAEVISAEFPDALRAESPRREICWSDYVQGALFRADGKPWSAKLDWRHAVMCVFGFTAADESLAVIVETPFDVEATLSDDGARAMSASLALRPSMGRMSYPRRVRFVPLVPSGYVAIAGAFRTYAQRHGLWKSFKERINENPEVEKLRGAFVAGAGYWWDDSADQVAAMKTMRAMGFKRAWLFSPKLFIFSPDWTGGLGVEPNRMTDAQLAEIQSLGYLCAPFLQVEEAGPSIGMDKFATDAKGEKILRWQIGESKYWEIAKWRIPSMLAQLDAQLVECAGIHFDTLTAMPLVENWGKSLTGEYKGIHFDTLTAAALVEHWGERAYDCAGDARLRMEVADYYRRRGKVICSESMRDWGNLRQDLATSKAFTPVNGADPRVWTVPLTDLVYHDATVRTHWEHHSYDDARCVHTLLQRRFHPFGMELNDLLTASPPVLFPEGMLYEFAHKEVTLPDGRKELEIVWTEAKTYRKRITDPATQAALPKALRVCKLNERHGVSRMTSHRFLDPASPLVQESEFASGLHVTVNFGDVPFALPDGRAVPARGSIVEE